MDAHQGHEQECDQGRTQAVERWPEASIDVASDVDHRALDEGRHGEQNPEMGHVTGWGEQGRGIVEQTQAGQHTVDAAIHRVGVEGPG